MIKILIEGEPIPAARPRFSHGHAYQPKHNREYRERVTNAARSAMGSKAPLTGAIAAVVKLYRKYKPTSRLSGDVDNHLKALFDGCNKVVFVDDAQITKCVVEKFCDKTNPRAEIEISEVVT